MPIEIEHKFLLANDDWKRSVIRRIRIRDGLIASNNGNKARVRIADSNATITLKSRRHGPIRTEFEYAIPYSDAVTPTKMECVRRCEPHLGPGWSPIGGRAPYASIQNISGVPKDLPVS